MRTQSSIIKGNTILGFVHQYKWAAYVVKSAQFGSGLKLWGRNVPFIARELHFSLSYLNSFFKHYPFSVAEFFHQFQLK